MAVTHDVAAGLTHVRERIARACAKVGRDEDSVRLVAVSKVHPVEAIAAAREEGQLLFGESYVQELVDKAAAFEGTELHFIGRLQTNKVKALLAVKALSCVETVGSTKLADELDKRARERGRRLKVLVQVNVGREPQKSGVMPEELEPLVHHVQSLEALELRGLMAIPPADRDPRPFFVTLRELADRFELPERSMGMSDDLEVAIEEGATLVRVGTAIFGARG
ncbi:MAG: YggS family pyridoxal phosphate-dependent enzyme [Sandaracinus sp.]|nr:YggS family pyridoxal phosphate-dependent enzyme [Sandaracinus sp.]